MAAESPQILVVDDDCEIREVVSDLLERLGYRTHSAADGAEALEWLGHHVPDLILLDVRMPVMSGGELLRRISDMGGLREVPIVLMSAYADIEDFAQAKSVRGLLPKPFELAQLRTLLRQLVRAP